MSRAQTQGGGKAVSKDKSSVVATVKDAFTDTVTGYVRDRTVEATKAILEEVDWARVAGKAVATGKGLVEDIRERAKGLTKKTEKKLPVATKSSAKAPSVVVTPRVRTVKR